VSHPQTHALRARITAPREHGFHESGCGPRATVVPVHPHGNEVLFARLALLGVGRGDPDTPVTRSGEEPDTVRDASPPLLVVVRLLASERGGECVRRVGEGPQPGELHVLPVRGCRQNHLDLAHGGMLPDRGSFSTAWDRGWAGASSGGATGLTRLV